MGCFDTVLVPCPRCRTINEFQSKGGECTLAVYELHEAPADVLSNVNRHAPVTCAGCKTPFSVDDQTLLARVTIAQMGTMSDDDRVNFYDELFQVFCRSCGRHKSDSCVCHCTNDE